MRNLTLFFLVLLFSTNPLYAGDLPEKQNADNVNPDLIQQGLPDIHDNNLLDDEFPAPGRDQGVISVNPDFIEFERVGLRGFHRRFLTISNNGEDNLLIRNITIDNEAFTSNFEQEFNIAGGESSELAVTFDPFEPGEHNATLTIHSSDENTPEVTVHLTGIAVDWGRIGVDPDAIETNESGEHILTITNIGDQLLQFYPYLIVNEGPEMEGNFLGQYYNNGFNEDQLVFERLDEDINFDWGEGSPGDGVQADNFYVRWTASFLIQRVTMCNIRAICDGGVRLWIDDELVIDDWRDWDGLRNVQLTFIDRAHTIVMEYFEAEGDASAALMWNTDDNHQFRPFTGFPGDYWITYSPNQGVTRIDPGESTEMTVTINAENLAGGDYDADIYLNNMEEEGEDFLVNIILHVTPLIEITVEPEALDFGEVDVGQSEDLTLTISNTGNMDLTVSDVTIDNEVFTSNFENEITIPRGENYELTVTFESHETGDYQGTATIHSNDDNNPEVAVSLTGSSFIPPTIVIEPDAIETHESGQHVLTLSNAGEYDLNWNTQIEIVSGPEIQPGFLASYYHTNRGNPPGFEGLIFERIEDRILHDWGEGGPGNGVPNEYFGVRWVGSFYVHEAGEHYFRVYGDDGVQLWVGQTAVIDDWRVAAGWREGRINLQPGWHAFVMYYFEHTGGAAVHVQWTTPDNQQLRYMEAYVNPYWMGFGPVAGVNTPNEETEVTVAINAEGLEDGRYESNIHFLSNDPNNEDYAVNVVLGIGPELEMIVEQESLDFGEVAVGQTDQLMINIGNNGFGELIIDDVVVDGEGFSTDFDQELVVIGGQSSDLTVIFEPGAAGEYQAMVTLHSNDENNPEVSISLTGIGYIPPIIVVDPEAIETWGSGEHVVTVSNEGDLDLEWNANLEVIAEPGEDNNQRSVRRTDDGDVGPLRDNPGDVIDRIGWDYDNDYAPGLGFGLAWDYDNDWMWCASFDLGGIYAVDPNNDFEQVTMLEVPWRDPQPFGLGWMNGILYNTVREREDIGGYIPLSLIQRWDSEGNNLGNINTQNYPMAATCSPQDNLLILLSWMDTRVRAYSIEGDNLEEEWSFELDIDEIEHLFAYGSILWVDEHTDGHLWVRYGDDIYQINPNLDEDSFEIVQHHNGPAQGGIAAIGLGHDTHNLWLPSVGDMELLIVDDGIEEVHLTWVTFDPSSGTVEPDASQEMTVPFNEEELELGEYEADIHLTSNDPNNPDVAINVVLHIGDSPVIDVDQESLDFGVVYIGETEQLELNISNIGGADLTISDIVVDGEGFSTSFQQEIMVRRDIPYNLRVTFEPPAVAEYQGTLTIHSDDEDNPEVVVSLAGNGVDPPTIIVDPEAIESSESSEHIVTITNEGDVDLVWNTNLDLISEPGQDYYQRSVRRTDERDIGPSRDNPGDVLARIGWDLVEEDQYAYYNPAGFGYAWDYDNEWMWYTYAETGVLVAVDPNNDYEVVASYNSRDYSLFGAGWMDGILYTAVMEGRYIDFEFRNFLIRWDSEGNNLGNLDVPVYPRGMSCSPQNNLLILTSVQDSRIRAYSVNGDNVEEEWSFDLAIDEIEHPMWTTLQWVDEHPDGHLWVRYHNNVYQINPNPDEDSFEIVQQFEGITEGNMWFGGIGHDTQNLWIPNPSEQTTLIVDDGIVEEAAAWVSFEPTEGVVAPDESMEMIVTLRTEGFIPGDYEADIQILSNDPHNPNAPVNVILHVLEIPEISVEPQSLDFGEVTVGESGQLTLSINSDGNTDLVVNDVTIAGDAFTSDFEQEFAIPSGEGSDLTVTFEPPEGGEHQGTITIHSNDEENPEVNVSLTGVGIMPPTIVVDPDAVETNETGDHTLTISNTGDFDLEYTTEIETISGPEFQRGFSASYRRTSGGANPWFVGDPVFTRNDEVIDFDWGEGGPGNGLNNDDFGAVWIGNFYAHEAGDHTFRMLVNDGMRIWLSDGRLVYNGWEYVQGWREHTEQFEEGWHYIGIEYFEWQGAANAHFQWRTPDDDNSRLLRPYNFPHWMSINHEEGTLAPDASVDINLAIEADGLEVGRYESDIHFLSNDPNNADLAVNVLLIISEDPIISVEPESVDFGQIDIGATDNQILTITNLGLSDLTVSDIATEGAYFSTDFEAEFTVAPNESAELTVTFAPEESGEFAGTLTITSDDPENGELVVNLTGSGVRPPIIGVEPVEIVSDNGGDYTVTISNSGGSAMNWETEVDYPQQQDNPARNVRSLNNAPQGEFSISDRANLVNKNAGRDDPNEWIVWEPAQGSVEPEGTQDLNITLDIAGLETGDYNANLHILSNDPENGDVVVDVLLQINLPILTVNTDVLNFGNVMVGNRAERYFTVENQGNEDLIVSNMVVAGVGFGVDFEGEFVLAPGRGSTFTVTLIPEQEGNLEGTVTITSNDPQNGEVIVSLNGTGTERQNAIIVVDHEFLDFGDVYVGDSPQLDLIISNNTLPDLIISDITVEGEEFSTNFRQEFIISRNLDYILTVTFEPPEPGEYQGVLTIHSNDADNPELDIPLSGIAFIPPTISVDPEAIESSESSEHTVTISNEGDLDLEWNTNLNLISEPEQDNNLRSIRRTDDGDIGPRRDEPGDVLGRFRWTFEQYDEYQYNNGAGFGYAWDDVNEWMWFTNTQFGVVAALDPNNDYEPVVSWNLRRHRFFGADWMNGVLYTSAREGQFPDYHPLDYLVRWDSEGNHLGELEVPAIPLTATCSQENNWLILADWRDSRVRAYSIDGDNVEEVWSFNLNIQFTLGLEFLSMQWVDQHPDGPLWIRDWNDVYQINPNPEEDSFEIVHHFEGITQGGQDLLGIGHDTHNLWLPNNETDETLIIDDGIVEEVAQWLTFEPTGGVIAPDESMEMIVTLSIEGFVPGDYEADIELLSNDPHNPNVAVNVILHVPPLPVISVEPQALDFGEVAVGETEELTVTISSDGNTDLVISDVTIAGDGFTSEFEQELTIPTGESSDLTVIFEPPEGGEHQGTLTIHSDDEDNPEVDVSLTGAGLSPPTITVDPEAVATNETGDHTLTISNTGDFDLEYTTDIETISGPEFQRGFRAQYRHTSGGGNPWFVGDPVFERVDEVIDFDWGQGGPGGGLDNDNFGVVWMGHFYAHEAGDYTFRMLIDDGIRIWLADGNLNYNGWGFVEGWREHTINFEEGWHYLGIEYFEWGGAANAHFQWRTPDNENFRLLRPYTGIHWMSINHEEGTLAPDASIDMNLAIEAGNLEDGRYESDIHFLSNDPNNADLAVNVLLIISQEPTISVEPESIDFGQIDIGNSDNQVLTITNLGGSDLTVSDVVTEGAQFSTDFEAEFTVAPDESAELTVTFAPEEGGDFEGMVTITSDDPENGEVIVNLAGTGVGQPIIGVEPVELISENGGDHAITISNTGNIDLNWESQIEYPQQRDNLVRGVRSVNGAPRSQFTNSNLANHSNNNIWRDDPDEWITWEPAEGVIEPEATQEVNITLDITGLDIGNYEADLHVLSDDPQNGDIVVDVLLQVIRPVISVDPEALNFGEITVGESEELNLTVGNDGNENLTVSNVVADGGGFGVNFEGEFIVAPGNTTDITVSFEPPQAGNFEGTVTITSSDPQNDAVTINLSGNGTEPQIPVIAVEPEALNFGAVTTGESSNLPLTVSNTGNTTLTVSNVVVNGAYFSSNYEAQFDVAPNESAEISVTFSPGEVGDFEGTVTITSNDPQNGEVVVSLNGTGTEEQIPVISVEPEALNFGAVTVGESSNLPVTVSNTGNTTLTVSNVVVNGAYFSSNFEAQFDVAPNESAEISVTFSPGEVGDFEGTVTITSNDPQNGEVVVSLNGTGTEEQIPVISVEPEALNFGAVTVGESSNLPVTVSNTGNTTLTVSNVVVNGAYLSSNYEAQFDVAPNESAEITVTFAPGEVGDFEGTVTFTSNDPQNGEVAVSVSGSGIEEPIPVISIEPEVLDFDEVIVGESNYLPITINNTGNATLSVSDILVNGVYFDTNFQAEFDVAPNESAEITVTFAPEEVGNFEGTLTITSDDPSNGEVVVGLAGAGIELLDIPLISSTDTPGTANSSVIAGDLLFIADSESGLTIFDISDPGDPVEIGTLDTPGDARDIVIIGDLAYIADGEGGLRIIDISDPENPVEIGFFDTPGTAYEVEIDGNYAYVADGEGGLQVIDISDPENPEEVAFLDLPTDALGLTIVGDFAYVACAESGLHIIDISDPANPREVGDIDTPGIAQTVKVIGDYAYVADGEGGLRIIDVTNPANPFEIGFYDTGGFTSDVFIVGNYAFVADGEGGLKVIDITDPENPLLAGVEDTAGFASGIIIDGDLAYVADSESGILIFDVSNFTGAFADISISPLGLNFNDLLLGQSEELTVTIHNRGRAELTISSITVTGDYFTTDFGGEFRLVPDASADLIVTFTPEEAGDYEETITIVSDDPENGEITVSLTGTGIEPSYAEIVVEPASLDFGEVNIRNSEDLVVTISNAGEEELTVSDIGINGEYFETDFEGETVLEQGESFETAVTFMPEEPGQFAGVMIISSNDPDNGELEVQLSGTGVNTPPEVVNPIDDMEIDEDSGLLEIADLDVVFLDIDDDVLMFGVDGSDELNLNITDSNVLTLEPSDNFNGSDLEVTVTANDGWEERDQIRRSVRSTNEMTANWYPNRDLGTSLEFLVTVRPVNDAPVVVQELEDYVAYQGTISVEIVDLDDVFFDIDGDVLSYSIADIPEEINASIDEDNLLSFSYDEDYLLLAGVVITVTATDEDGLSVDESFRFSVRPEPERPVVINPIDDIVVDEDPGRVVIADLENVFMDNDDENLEYDFATDAEELNMELNDNVLIFDPEENFNTQNASIDVFVYATDWDNLTAELSFTITISPVNDAPVVNNEINDVAIDEDSNTIHITRVDNVFIDVDNDELDFGFTGAPDEFNMQITDEGILLLQPDENFNIPDGVEILVTAEDPSGLMAEDTFVVFIRSSNDPPELIEYPDQPITANAGDIVEFSFRAIDVDGDQVSFRWEDNAGMPDNALTDNHDGTADIYWETELGDVGEYSPTFILSDGPLEVELVVELVIVDAQHLVHFNEFAMTDVNHNVVIEYVEIEGESIPSLWEIGAFSPDQLLAGGLVWEAEGNNIITVWGDDPETDETDGFQEGETMSFIGWDNQAHIEYDMQVELIEGSLEWEANGNTVIGLDVIFIREQTLNLRSGWNLISLNIIPGDQYWNENEDRGPDVVLMLDQFLSDNGEQSSVHLMKNEHGRFYHPALGFSNFEYWDLGEGYHIKMNEETQGSWTGSPIPANAPLIINNGWNYIPYYPTYTLSADFPDFYVLATIIDDVVIAKNGRGRFLSPIGRFSNMPPWEEGYGYQIKMTLDEEIEFTYPEPEDEVAMLGDVDAGLGLYHAYPIITCENMSVLVSSVGGTTVNTGDQIVAYGSTERLVGIGEIDRDGLCGLSVWGNDQTSEEMDGLQPGEGFELRLRSNIHSTENSLMVANVLEGSGLEYKADGFVIVDLCLQSDVPDTYTLSEAYPNPFNSTTRISFGMADAGHASLKVFDMKGRLVKTLINNIVEPGYHNAIVNGVDLTTGVYLIQVEMTGFKATRKVVFLK